MHIVTSRPDSAQRVELFVKPRDPNDGSLNKTYIYRIYSKDGTEYDECQWDGNPLYKYEETENKIYRRVNAISGKTIIQEKLRKRGILGQFYVDANTYENEMEQYLLNYIQELKNYSPIVQYDKDKEMVLEEGDIPKYLVYDMDPRKLCVSIQRGFTFVESNLDNENKMLSGLVNRNGEFTGDSEQRINIEKFLEGGITTKSCYYRFSGGNGIGLGFTNFDPNSIVGFSGGDAFTSHTPKALKPRLESVSLISNILDGRNTLVSAEIAIQRYESDIGKIHEGSNGGRVKPDYIYGYDRDIGKYVREFNVPVIEFLYSSKEKYLELSKKRQESILDERENRRSRNSGEIVLQIRQIMRSESQDLQVWKNSLKKINEQVSQMPDSARKKQEAIQIISGINQSKENSKETEEPNIE